MYFLLLTSRNQHDFPKRSGLHDCAMRLGRFGLRKFFAAYRTQHSVSQTGHERSVNACQVCWWRVRHHHSAKIDIALHRVAWIDLHAAAASDNRNTTAFRESDLS